MGSNDDLDEDLESGLIQVLFPSPLVLYSLSFLTCHIALVIDAASAHLSSRFLAPGYCDDLMHVVQLNSDIMPLDIRSPMIS